MAGTPAASRGGGATIGALIEVRYVAGEDYLEKGYPGFRVNAIQSVSHLE